PRPRGRGPRVRPPPSRAPPAASARPPPARAPPPPRAPPPTPARRYRRNRVRLELLPTLERFDPRIRENLLRLSRQAREEKEVLDSLALALFEGSKVGRLEGSELSNLPTFQLSNLEARRAVLRRALAILLRRLAGFEVEINAALLDRLLALCRGEGPAALDLPGCGLRARRKGDRLIFEPTRSVEPELPEEVPLAVP